MGIYWVPAFSLWNNSYAWTCLNSETSAIVDTKAAVWFCISLTISFKIHYHSSKRSSLIISLKNHPNYHPSSSSSSSSSQKKTDSFCKDNTSIHCHQPWGPWWPRQVSRNRASSAVSRTSATEAATYEVDGRCPNTVDGSDIPKVNHLGWC